MTAEQSELTKLREELQMTRQLLDSLINNSTVAFVVIDLDGVILRVNNTFEKVFGWGAEEAVGMKLPFIPDSLYGDFKSMLRDKRWEVSAHETLRQRKDKSLFVASETVTPIRDEQGRLHAVAFVLRDITERKQTEQLINHMAFHDALTDLPNRRYFSDRLEEAIGQAKENGQQLAVMFLDLDRFKIINDSLGHDVGDHVLQAVAERLGKCLRGFDTIARLGGDEFTILVPEIPDVETAKRIAERILEAFQKPFQIAGQEFHLTTSIGMALYPEHGDTALDLMKHADVAMYQVKEQGKNSFQIYSRALNDQAMIKMEMETELRKAVEREEFTLHYQPKYNALTGEITGMEALVRWEHAERGLMPPGQFITLAEETGLIIPLGEWVMRQACRQIKQWKEEGYASLPVAVNLSLRQFEQKNLTETVAAILQETGIDPWMLELEITESIAMNSPDQVIQKLKELQNLGVRISIDDFGTGFSSLSYLKHFPIQTLKIDRSFIQDMAAEENNATLVSAIIAMAHSLKLKVIAEGVETSDQLDLLREGRCNEVQGYLFSRPLSAGDFKQLLAGCIS